MRGTSRKALRQVHGICPAADRHKIGIHPEALPGRLLIPETQPGVEWVEGAAPLKEVPPPLGAVATAPFPQHPAALPAATAARGHTAPVSSTKGIHRGGTSVFSQILPRLLPPRRNGVQTTAGIGSVADLGSPNPRHHGCWWAKAFWHAWTIGPEMAALPAGSQEPDKESPIASKDMDAQVARCRQFSTPALA